MSGLPAFPPAAPPELANFWEATRDDVLLLPRCTSCGETFWYPRAFCPRCHSSDLSWEPAGGGGSIYSFTVVERGHGPWREAVPYVVAYVELDEGPRLMTNIIDADSVSLSIGRRVALVFEAAGEYKIPRFVPANDQPKGW
jgi:uncharacterized protein